MSDLRKDKRSYIWCWQIRAKCHTDTSRISLIFGVNNLSNTAPTWTSVCPTFPNPLYKAESARIAHKGTRTAEASVLTTFPLVHGNIIQLFGTLGRRVASAIAACIRDCLARRTRCRSRVSARPDGRFAALCCRTDSDMSVRGVVLPVVSRAGTRLLLVPPDKSGREAQ